jgi:hypothetical protein
MRVCKYRPICRIEDIIDLPPENIKKWKEKYCWKKMEDCVLFSQYEEFARRKEIIQNAIRSLMEFFEEYVGENYFEGKVKKSQDTMRKIAKEIL